MSQTGTYEKAKHYIESHSLDSYKKSRIGNGPCITLSRETGAGADRVCERLSDFFKAHNREFTIFDKNLIDKIIEDHHLPQKLSSYLVEDKLSTIGSVMNELLGVHPSTATLLHKTTKTILELGEIGNVIIVGRASNIITFHLKNSFHVRLVAPHELRVKNMQQYYHMTFDEATDFIKKEDKKRNDYVIKNFNKNPEDPNLYHLILNTHLFNNEQCAEIIGKAVMTLLPKFFMP